MDSEMVLDRMDLDIETQASEDVLVMELGESYSDEDADRVLTDYEALHGRAYKRPAEGLVEFQKRARAFKPTKQELDMDRTTAVALLRQLRETPLPKEEDKSRAHRKRIHDIEDALGVTRTDFSKAPSTPAKAEAESKLRFNALEFEKIDESAEKAHIRRLPEERIALVNVESNVGTLYLVIAEDGDPGVIAAAQQRLGQVELDSEVLAATMQRPRAVAKA